MHRGVLRDIDAIGRARLPGDLGARLDGLAGAHRERLREVLERTSARRAGSGSPRPATRRGATTSARQVDELLEAARGARRAGLLVRGHDLHPETCHQDGFHEDERQYHFGLQDRRRHAQAAVPHAGPNGVSRAVPSSPQLTAGVAAGLCRDSAARRPKTRRDRLITGGAGSSAPTSPTGCSREGRRCCCSTTSRGPASSGTCGGSRERHGERVQVGDRRHPRSLPGARRGANAPTGSSTWPPRWR